ncbi:MAG: TIGR02449 family protein [Pseudomonadales bacterium]|nr:TIGR02449 family protein [Pseudomonadales bacterium]
MESLDINALAGKIDTLIKLCDQLSVENQIMKEQQENWPVERARLIEQNNQAKQKIVQIISRLKSLEQAG